MLKTYFKRLLKQSPVKDANNFNDDFKIKENKLRKTYNMTRDSKNQLPRP